MRRGAYRECAQAEIHLEERFQTILMSGVSSGGVGGSTLDVMSFAAEWRLNWSHDVRFVDGDKL